MTLEDINYEQFYNAWEKFKEMILHISEKLKELLGDFLKIFGKKEPVKVRKYHHFEDFYVRADYTYIPVFKRNMPYHRRNF